MVTQQQIDALRAKTKTGFRCVHEHPKGSVRRFQARVFRERKSLGYFRSPIEAAMAVAEFFTELYGEGWEEMSSHSGQEPVHNYKRRRSPKCCITKDPGGLPGFIVVTYLTGRRKIIQPRGRGETFATRAEARAEFRRWLSTLPKIFHLGSRVKSHGKGNGRRKRSDPVD